MIKMNRGMLLFFGGVILVIAVFLPTSVLQDSRPVRPARRSKASKAQASSCPPFETPHAVVGEHTCIVKRKRNGDQHLCKLRCPAGMTPRPAKQRMLVRCHKGKWHMHNEHIHCVAAKSVSLVEQQMAPPVLLNRLLTTYLNHSYSYLAMAYFFDRADVQLPGFHAHFRSMWKTSLDMATDLMTYLNKRGGYIDLQELPRPRLTEKLHVAMEEGHTGLVAMETAVDMEKESHALILDIVERVERRRNQDIHLVHTLEDGHLSHKVKVIKELVDYITRLRAFEQTGEGDYELGEYALDNELH